MVLAAIKVNHICIQSKGLLYQLIKTPVKLKKPLSGKEIEGEQARGFFTIDRVKRDTI